MFKGIAYALIACFIWGLIFIVPQFMEGFSSMEVALGRYSFYGAISLLIFCKDRLQGSCSYPLSIWGKACTFSLISTFVYYTFVVLSLRLASPAICTLILGISPITIAFYGNWMHKECSYRSLLLPSLLIMLGLILVNAPAISMRESFFEYALGLMCCAVSLACWSWYAVANSHFLKSNPQVASSDWATLVGVSALVWVALFGIITLLFFGEQWDMGKYLVWDTPLIRFLIGGAILGLLCSWVGGFLWNRASTYLSVSLVGQMTIFETIFGLIFVYMLEQRLPPQMEAVGILILFSAVLIGIRYQQLEAEKSLNKLTI